MKYRDDVEFYSKNGDIESINNFPVDISEESGLAYEVMRVNNGKPLFIKNHLERLNNSLKLSLKTEIDTTIVSKYANDLIIRNKQEIGNIKIVVTFINNSTEIYLYYIPHRYPSLAQITDGVRVLSQNSTRNIPSAKISDWEIRGTANMIISL